jgi:hypothetical protein
MEKEIEIACELVHETDKAYLIDAGLDDNVWIPKSKVKDYCEDVNGNIDSVFIPESLAYQKGLI